jgi:hypothetical protein
MNNLFFLGLVQPLCAIMPIAEVQARWLATLLSGEYALPVGQEIRRRTVQEYRKSLRGYLKTARHTIQVRDCAIYCYGIRREMERGRRRARRRGHALEIPARAHEVRAADLVPAD